MAWTVARFLLVGVGSICGSGVAQPRLVRIAHHMALEREQLPRRSKSRGSTGWLVGVGSPNEFFKRRLRHPSSSRAMYGRRVLGRVIVSSAANTRAWRVACLGSITSKARRSITSQ